MAALCSLIQQVPLRHNFETRPEQNADFRTKRFTFDTSKIIKIISDHERTTDVNDSEYYYDFVAMTGR